MAKTEWKHSWRTASKAAAGDRAREARRMIRQARRRARQALRLAVDYEELVLPKYQLLPWEIY